MVSCGDNAENYNIITVAWTGTICSDPPMCYISVRPERHSHALIERTGEFVINLTTTELARQTDWCGVKSGRDYNKFRELGLHAEAAQLVKAPLIQESPLNIECRVTEEKKLGSHSMFLAKVVAVHADEAYMDEKGKFSFAKAKPIVYSHGEYYRLGEKLGTFGYSIKKKGKKKGKKPSKKK